MPIALESDDNTKRIQSQQQKYEGGDQLDFQRLGNDKDHTTNKI